MKREAGFTLVELLIVITVIGVMIAIAALNLAGESKKNRLKEATTQFYSDLKRCRVDAMTKVTDVNTRGYGFKFIDATSYKTFEFNDLDNDYNYDTAPADEAINPVTITVPYGVQVSSGALTTPLFFDRRGWVRSASWSTVSGTTFIFSLPGVTTARCVVLSTSRIREGVWKDGACVSN